MKLMDKAMRTFCKVRDSISPTEYPCAWRKLFSIPMAFYAVYDAEMAVKMLRQYEDGDERTLGRAVAYSLDTVRELIKKEED